MGYDTENLKIYHFTHIDNLPSILTDGLFADTKINDEEYENLGDVDIKARRKIKLLPNDQCVASYVPFYFATKSPMMYKQHANKILKNEDTVYLVANAHVLIGKYDWFCSDMNAAKEMANFYCSVDDLENKVPWDIMGLTYWHNDEANPDRKERRMAEFLVCERVAWDDFLGVAVYNKAAQDRVLGMNGIQDKYVAIRKNWYF